MKEEKSPEVEEKNENPSDPTKFEEVDVSLDEDDIELVLDETSEEETELPIPEEWIGKPEEEIALLRENQELKKKLDESKKDWFDKYARLQAEFENFRKRSLKEKENYINYASAQVISKLLTALDNFEIMLSNIEENLEPTELQGIQMIFKELYGVFEKEGMTPIKAKGEKFDPFVHEILTIEYTDEYPEETILEEFQKGYKLKDRVLRPSKVKIAKQKKGEEKTEEEPSEIKEEKEDNE